MISEDAASVWDEEPTTASVSDNENHCRSLQTGRHCSISPRHFEATVSILDIRDLGTSILKADTTASVLKMMRTMSV